MWYILRPNRSHTWSIFRPSVYTVYIPASFPKLVEGPEIQDYSRLESILGSPYLGELRDPVGYVMDSVSA